VKSEEVNREERKVGSEEGTVNGMELRLECQRFQPIRHNLILKVETLLSKKRNQNE